jgi:hypothetical protein
MHRGLDSGNCRGLFPGAIQSFRTVEHGMAYQAAALSGGSNHCSTTASDAFFQGLIQKAFGHHCKTSNNLLTV